MKIINIIGFILAIPAMVFVMISSALLGIAQVLIYGKTK